MVDGIAVHGARHLSDVLAWLREEQALVPPPQPLASKDIPEVPDVADVIGQPEATWALEVAAAGGHHIFLIGPPETGKAALARRLPGILPTLTTEEALEVAAIYSSDGSMTSATSMRVPPLVAPHHSISLAALIGGGTGVAAPGAVSKAHRGVLLLDEAVEYDTQRLEALRAVLEQGEVRLARSHGIVTYPATCQLVLTSNPCPRGCTPEAECACACAPSVRRRYLNRIPGPVLERIDIRIRMRRTTETVGGRPDNTATVRQRVLAARDRAAHRWTRYGHYTNSDVPGTYVRTGRPITDDATALLDRAVQRGMITSTGAERTLRVAWTLADLADRDRPNADDIAGALELRRMP